MNSSTVPSVQQQHSLPVTTLDNRYHSTINNLSAMSEPNIVDLPNQHKVNARQQSTIHNLDHSTYIPLTDANPIMQTILERVHDSNSMIAPRQNSVISNSNNMRQNSSDNNNGTNSLETSRIRSQSKSNEDDDNESTSSESSSTKSGRTIVISSSQSTTNKTTSTTIQATSSLFRISKRQLIQFIRRRFIRKNVKKFIQKHHDIVDIDEDEEDGVINDGDLKYKGSRNLKEQSQFDKTQLLQTIINAHEGPIWCMK